mmetsp:Transcript_93693/g.201033  ORF Transcript_93693/g.201033 Transcript_93693/m.201033 type:complete len:299 (+) Transcript_93693:1047-1943(+)
MPSGVEGCASILHKADPEEPVHGLGGSGEDADVGEHAAEENPLHSTCPQLVLQGSGSEGSKGPLVHHNLARLGPQGRVELIALVVGTNKVVVDRGAIAVRAAVGDGEARCTGRCQEAPATLHSGAHGAVQAGDIVLAHSARGLEEVGLHVNEHKGRVRTRQREGTAAPARHIGLPRPGPKPGSLGTPSHLGPPDEVVRVLLGARSGGLELPLLRAGADRRLCQKALSEELQGLRWLLLRRLLQQGGELCRDVMLVQVVAALHCHLELRLAVHGHAGVSMRCRTLQARNIYMKSRYCLT